MSTRVDAELLGSLLGTAIEAALAAGKLLMAQREDALATVETKRDINDLVTAADKAAERLIVERIQLHHPDDGIVGEEGERIHPDAAIQWLIDPLDGTTNYVYGSGPWAVSIGVEHDGVPIVGVIHIPAFGETFSAARNCGAFLNDARLQVSTLEQLATAVIGFDGPTWVHHGHGVLLSELGNDVRAVRRIGSCAVSMANVAASRFDGFFVHDVGPWDISAGTVIVREAGGWVGDSTGGPPTTSETIACGPGIAGALQQLLNVTASSEPAT